MIPSPSPGLTPGAVEGRQSRLLATTITMSTIHKYRGCSIEISHDPHAGNPREEWDCHIGTFATWHRRYEPGDIAPTISSTEYLGALPKTELVIPVYMYDHSGRTISTKPFSCPWDSGQLGIIHVSLKKAREEWAACLKGGKGRGWDRTLVCPNSPDIHGKTLREQITRVLEGEIESVDQWMTGSVYYWSVTDPNGEAIDSCGGYYGDSEVVWHEDYDKCGYAIQCARDAVDGWAKSANAVEQMAEEVAHA